MMELLLAIKKEACVMPSVSHSLYKALSYLCHSCFSGFLATIKNQITRTKAPRLKILLLSCLPWNQRSSDNLRRIRQRGFYFSAGRATENPSRCASVVLVGTLPTYFLWPRYIFL